jgi:hypothetical protein
MCLASSYNFKAEVEIPEGGAEGMLVTHGGRFAGYGFYLLKGKPVYTWNLVGSQTQVKWEGSEALAPASTHSNSTSSTTAWARNTAFGSPSGLGRSGTEYSRWTARSSRQRRWKKPSRCSCNGDENFDVGADTGTPVNDEDYQVPFKFTGKLDKLTLTIDRPKLSPEDIKKLKMAMHNNPASE